MATTTMLGSVLSDITECAGGRSSTLMAPGDDPHDFALSSDQVAQLVSATLVVSNGLGLEAGLAPALMNAAEDGATIVEVAPQVEPLPFTRDGESRDDPHFWMDVSRMALAAEVIGEKLAERTGESSYRGCGEQVAEALERTDRQVRDILAEVPAGRRVLVTDHHAFGYFAAAYDFEIAGVVVPGGSTEAEPSSQELAALTEVIRDRGVPAVFSDTADSSRVVEAVVAEAGEDVRVVPLYVGSVGPEGSGAATYAEMMVANAERIAQALRG
ncbi:MAG: metal ABC transporter solute-binding protein, Zn/Mn family [Dermatophilaceae bacterium]|nr:metal ABC transporter substrate-binding protein [Intrasporangiaceae bacterium]